MRTSSCVRMLPPITMNRRLTVSFIMPGSHHIVTRCLLSVCRDNVNVHGRDPEREITPASPPNSGSPSPETFLLIAKTLMLAIDRSTFPISTERPFPPTPTLERLQQLIPIPLFRQTARFLLTVKSSAFRKSTPFQPFRYGPAPRPLRIRHPQLLQDQLPPEAPPARPFLRHHDPLQGGSQVRRRRLRSSRQQHQRQGTRKTKKIRNLKRHFKQCNYATSPIRTSATTSHSATPPASTPTSSAT